jgi:TrkA-N domain/RyR domain
VVIAGVAVAAVVLGVIGYRQFLPGRRFSDYVYRSLQLFVVYVEHTGDETGGTRSLPIALDVARFLAPAAAAAASIRAVLALFGERAARAWVRYFVRDHVGVCGLGPLGARLAIAFQEAGYRVVAVEPDGNDAAVHDCRAHGVIVLIGDATDRQLLLKAGLLSARYLVVASGDDGANADVALAARDVAGIRRRALPCFVHIVHPGLSGLLVESSLALGAEGPLRFEFFNAWESVPPMVLDEFPPGGSEDDRETAPHMLVVGTGQLGRALVVYAARRWATEAAAARQRLEVTLVGPGADEAGEDLARRYPRLADVCELRPHDVGTESADFERAAYAEDQGVTSAYVTVDDDATGLRAALTLSRVVPHIRIVVLTRQHAGLASLVSGIRPGASPIALFDVLDRSCRPDILLNGTIELLARAIHRDYVRAQEATGRTAADNPSLRDWDELPDGIKEANRAQAADVGRKLAAVDCRLKPWTDWTGDGLTFSPEEIERMAEMEHERWCREREADGWKFGPTKDDRRKTTPYLVGWDELADDVKEYDRVAMRALPEMLMNAGFEVVRLPAGARRP